MRPVESPCTHCPDRAITMQDGEDGKRHPVSCHSSCERYAEFKRYRDELCIRRRAEQQNRDSTFTASSNARMADRAKYEKQRGKRYN